jgi:hypothetical protein
VFESAPYYGTTTFITVELVLYPNGAFAIALVSDIDASTSFTNRISIGFRSDNLDQAKTMYYSYIKPDVVLYVVVPGMGSLCLAIPASSLVSSQRSLQTQRCAMLG